GGGGGRMHRSRARPRCAQCARARRATRHSASPLRMLARAGSSAALALAGEPGQPADYVQQMLARGHVLLGRDLAEPGGRFDESGRLARGTSCDAEESLLIFAILADPFGQIRNHTQRSLPQPISELAVRPWQLTRDSIDNHQYLERELPDD